MPNGSGGFQIIELDGGRWSDFDQLINDFKRFLRVGEIYVLGKDTLPEGLPDIRGQVEDEPPLIVGYIDHRAFTDLPMYFGISNESEAPQED